MRFGFILDLMALLLVVTGLSMRQNLFSAVMTSIDVGYNSLNEEAALAIVRAVKSRDKMTSLGLARCGIGPTGAKEIAEYVSFSAVVKNINLRDNSLGTEGWCAIFHALRDNKDNTIESWYLSGQGINLEIAKALAEYVSVSSVPH